MLEKFFIDPDKARLEAKKSQIRKEELLLSNIKYQLAGKLRQEGAIKVSVDNFDRQENQVTATARFELKGYKEGKFNFKKNHMGNFILKNFENSIDESELVKAEKLNYEIDPVEIKMTFDLSKVFAKEGLKESVDLIYPTVGLIGTMKKDNIDELSVKKLCQLAAEAYGLTPVFVNDFKVNYVENEELPEMIIKDEMAMMQQGLKSYTRENNALKEKEQTKTLRDNLVNSIESKAKDYVKRATTSYKTGTTKILSAETFLEFINNRFDGHTLVKAKIGDRINTYALPVVKNQLVVKNHIDSYKTEESEYKNELEEKLNKSLNDGLSQDLEIIKAEFLTDKQTAMGITAARVSEVQKSFKVNKEFIPEGLEPGNIMTFDSGLQYKIVGEIDAQVFTLVLVN